MLRWNGFSLDMFCPPPPSLFSPNYDITKLCLSSIYIYLCISQGPWDFCIRCHYCYNNLVFVLMLYLKHFFKCSGTLGKECFKVPGHLVSICYESTLLCIRNPVGKQAEQSKVTSRRWFDACKFPVAIGTVGEMGFHGLVCHQASSTCFLLFSQHGG